MEMRTIKQLVACAVVAALYFVGYRMDEQRKVSAMSDELRTLPTDTQFEGERLVQLRAVKEAKEALKAAQELVPPVEKPFSIPNSPLIEAIDGRHITLKATIDEAIAFLKHLDDEQLPVRPKVVSFKDYTWEIEL